jgi:hypothetical protein
VWRWVSDRCRAAAEQEEAGILNGVHEHVTALLYKVQHKHLCELRHPTTKGRELRPTEK